jgi:hypothetical protein
LLQSSICASADPVAALYPPPLPRECRGYDIARHIADGGPAHHDEVYGWQIGKGGAETLSHEAFDTVPRHGPADAPS